MNTIINLMTSLGYPVERKGVCAGITQMWQQAYLSGGEIEEYRFLERLDKINSRYGKKDATGITRANIQQKMDEVHDKVKKNQVLSEDDKFLLEVHAMFDGIMTYQSAHMSKVGEGLFEGELPTQDDVEKISAVAASHSLEEKGGVIQFHTQPVVSTNNELQHFFDNLKELIREDSEELVISLSSGMHRIGIRYDTVKNSWTIINPGKELDDGLAFKAGGLSLKEAIAKNLTFPHESIGKAITRSLALEQNSLFNIVINTIKNNSNLNNLKERLDSFKESNLKSLTQEQTQLSNRGITLTTLAIRGNHVDFLNEYSEKFNQEFRDSLKIETEDSHTTPLDDALSRKRVEVIKLLVKNDALKMENIDHNTPVKNAILNGDYSNLFELLSFVDNINQINREDVVALRSKVVKEGISKIILDKTLSGEMISFETILNIKNILQLKDNFIKDLITIKIQDYENKLQKSIDILKSFEINDNMSDIEKQNVQIKNTLGRKLEEKLNDFSNRNIESKIQELNTLKKDCTFEIKAADKQLKNDKEWKPLLKNLALLFSGIGTFAAIVSIGYRLTIGRYGLFDNKETLFGKKSQIIDKQDKNKSNPNQEFINYKEEFQKNIDREDDVKNEEEKERPGF